MNVANHPAVNAVLAIMYKLLPRKVNGYWTVTLSSDESNVQYRSLNKANAQDWLNDNQSHDDLNAQAGVSVWRARSPEAA